MVLHRTNIHAAVLITVSIVFLSFLPVNATVLDFSGLPAGAVVSGQTPSGGTHPGDSFADFVLSCVNDGDGPNSIIVFDSQSPTGNDADLGTPNEDFDGPGVGWGGRQGAPGENGRSYDNLLIIAEDLCDKNGDDLVDDPDDEAFGGVFIFDYESAVQVMYVVLVDIDYNESAEIRLYGIAGLIATIPASALGNNSVQSLNCEQHLGVLRMEVEVSSSAAIAEIEYVPDTSPVEQATWGAVKATYSR
jgi:hypothetical protein